MGDGERRYAWALTRENYDINDSMLRGIYGTFECARRSALNGLLRDIRVYLEDAADGDLFSSSIERKRLLQEPSNQRKVYDKIVDAIVDNAESIDMSDPTYYEIRVQYTYTPYGFHTLDEVAQRCTSALSFIRYTVDRYLVRTEPDDGLAVDGEEV